MAAAAAGLAAWRRPPSCSRARTARHFAAVGSGISTSIATLMAKQGAVNVAEARGYHGAGRGQADFVRLRRHLRHRVQGQHARLQVPHAIKLDGRVAICSYGGGDFLSASALAARNLTRRFRDASLRAAFDGTAGASCSQDDLSSPKSRCQQKTS